MRLGWGTVGREAASIRPCSPALPPTGGAQREVLAALTEASYSPNMYPSITPSIYLSITPSICLSMIPSNPPGLFLVYS